MLPMSHFLHDALPGYDERNVLHDGCPECEYRAVNGIAAMYAVDDQNLITLWERMLVISNGKGENLGWQISACDMRMMDQLEYVHEISERLTKLGVRI